MTVKKNGGETTVKKLDIVKNPTDWIRALEMYLSGNIQNVHCPICNSAVEAKACCGQDRIGFVVISCHDCNKAAHFSRVEIPKEISAEEL